MAPPVSIAELLCIIPPLICNFFAWKFIAPPSPEIIPLCTPIAWLLIIIPLLIVIELFIPE